MFVKHAALVAAIALQTSIASAATLEYTSLLTGDQEPDAVETAAQGNATVSVDTDTESLSVSLSVTGITLDGLFDVLVEAPVGPVHLHNAAPGVNGPIVVPFAFDPTSYFETDTGFDLVADAIGYDDAIMLSGSTLSFTDFLAEADAGNIYFNVHTDAFPGGEIRGALAPIPLPATGVLLIAALGGVAALRRRKTA